MPPLGIGAPLPPTVGGRAALTADPLRGRVAQPGPLAPHAPVRPATVAAPAGPASTASESAVTEPPPNTDPALWRVLTSEERAFFAQQEAMGPLSYGTRIAERTLVAPRGGRLNLRG